MGTMMRRDTGEAPNQTGAEVVEKETSFIKNKNLKWILES